MNPIPGKFKIQLNEPFHPFFKNVMTVASIVIGVLYIERHITGTITTALEPLSKKVDSQEARIVALEPKVLLNEYRISLHELQLKEMIRPEEPRVPKREK